MKIYLDSEGILTLGTNKLSISTKIRYNNISGNIVDFLTTNGVSIIGRPLDIDTDVVENNLGVRYTSANQLWEEIKPFFVDALTMGALNNRLINLENNETIYQLFSFVGTSPSGQITLPTEATILDMYGDSVVDAIVVQADSNQKPSDTLSVDVSGNIVQATSLDNLGNYVLSSTPAVASCLIYYIVIKDIYSSNVSQNNIISSEKKVNYFGDILGGNYSKFEGDGTLVSFGNAITYRDELPSVLTPVSGAAAPDLVTHTIGGVARTLYSFDGGNTQEILSGSIEIPHDYAYGLPIEMHIHWRPSTTGTGVVKWFIDWEYSPAQGAPLAQTTLTVLATLSTNNQYWHLLHSFGNLPNTGFKLGGKIGFNLRRTPSDVQDTYAGDALFEQVAIHIPCDTLGSRQIYTK